MSKLTYQHTYRRRLPHIQPPGATLFVTFRLAGSLPAHVIEALCHESDKRLTHKQQHLTDPVLRQQAEYDEQKRLFAKIDHYLNTIQDGPHWLKDPRIAQNLADSLHYRHGKVYDLDTFCIMSNHGHVLFTPLPNEKNEYHSLSSIMHLLKRRTAQEANNILGRQGAFWQHESYDHIVRDEAELQRIRLYILQNPVQAGLVTTWSEWLWSFTRYL